MTKAQLRRLHKLTGEVEALQGVLPDSRAKEFVAKAKNALMDAIRQAEREE